LILKKISPDDVDQVSKFFTENSVDAITCFFSPFELTAETARWIACEPHKDRFYLGKVNNQIVGFSMLRGWDEGFTVPSFGIFIDHRKHGLGFGKNLLDLTIEEAERLQCPKIRLSVFASNQPAFKLYLSRGFKETNRSAVKHNNIADENIIMEKELE